MIQIKKTILTLVALLAISTGAWADETLLLTIENKGNTSFYSGSKTFDDKVTVTFSNEVSNYGDAAGWYGGGTASLLTVAGINGYTITSCKFYTDRGTASTGYTVQGESPSVYLFTREVFTDNSQSVSIGDPGIMKIEVYGTAPSASSATPVDIDWDAATKTGSFTMPGGNVTLEPEYYPQATVADGGVTAADADARATTDDPLVKVDATKLTGAKKLMYFVSNSGTTAPDYDAEGWTDQLPTAEGFTQQGMVYVWYYPVGIDEGVDGATATYSDGDICLQSITARIADAPLWNAEFDLTDAPEADKTGKWSTNIPEGGVVKGTEVTVTYTGTKKVIGVKAEKKAAEPVADIIWDGTNVTDLNVESTYASYTKEGIKLSGNAEQVQAEWNNSAYLGTPGMEFITMESGGFTFTAPTGKAFTKIEMKAVGSSGWGSANLGTGWAYNTGTVTWTGSAASTVKLLKDADMFSGDFISSIAFYLSE